MALPMLVNCQLDSWEQPIAQGTSDLARLCEASPMSERWNDPVAIQTPSLCSDEE